MVHRDKNYYKTYYQLNKEAARWRGIKNRYGLNKEDFFNLLEIQDNKCALCEKPFLSLSKDQVHIDHCHDTGRVRGLLCMPCNVGLGMLGDTEEGLNKALEYIKGEA